MILSVLSSLALVSGLMVVRAKNPVHSVLFPIPVFRNTSGLLLLLGLDFFAMIFPVVHIGAIAVSFLFVVMMFHIQIAEIHEEVLRYLPVSGIIGLIFWWEMFFILDNESIPLLPTQRNTTSLRYMVYAGKVRSWTNLETLGNLLYTYYSVWFLVPSLILLVAMIGAIVLTMHRTTKVKRQDVFRRNAIDSRRTIMRGMTDLLKESSFILVRIQFVRWPSCLDPLYDVLVEPLGYDALLLEYHGIEYPDLPEAPEKAISAFRTVKGNSYSHAHRKKWCRTAGSYGTIACTKAGLGGLSHRWFGIANSSLFYVFLVGMLSAFRVLSIINARPMSGILEQMNSTQVEDAAGFVLSLPGWVKAILAWIETVLLFREIHNNDHQQPTSLDCRHEMPIKSVKGSLIKAGKQEDLTELMMDRISKGERLS
ncbi:hypothetical protein L6452_12075 [Arctium lappa]|uniref:Uncharacterized protein n=1 Tax=Arctium lappa TaxID=4217 RepID=A0ACB9DPX7_ARCLA|nr:hypothetical protein L6452_12075 [Arctium lappa]